MIKFFKKAKNWLLSPPFTIKSVEIEINSLTVYICQDKTKLIIYGAFLNREKAVKYANNSKNITIVALPVNCQLN